MEQTIKQRGERGRGRRERGEMNVDQKCFAKQRGMDDTMSSCPHQSKTFTPSSMYIHSRPLYSFVLVCNVDEVVEGDEQWWAVANYHKVNVVVCV